MFVDSSKPIQLHNTVFDASAVWNVPDYRRAHIMGTIQGRRVGFVSRATGTPGIVIARKGLQG